MDTSSIHVPVNLYEKYADLTEQREKSKEAVTLKIKVQKRVDVRLTTKEPHK